MVRAVRCDDPDYPAGLHDLRRPPACIHVLGTLPAPGPTVGIVGSRRASELGRGVARTLARELTSAGVMIVSGGALGIDAAAHRGALDVGGPTIVVLPTTVDRPYPRRHRRLFSSIVEQGGVLMSEHAEAPKHVGAFCARNRIIAALSDLVIVVEAASRSGTRHTVDAARRLGRPLGAVPWAPGRALGAGGLEVLRGGGRVIAASSDALATLGLAPVDASEVVRPADPEQRAVLAALDARGGRVAGISEDLGRSASWVLAQIARLEVEGWIEGVPGGAYVRTGNGALFSPDRC